MRIAITGGTGVVGTALSKRLQALGHGTTTISRSPRGPGTIVWDPSQRRMDASALRHHDAVVHLAGESIRLRRSTASVKAGFRDSRLSSTDLIARSMAAVAGMDDGPRTLVSMSGTHYYGDRGDEVLTEDSAPGGGFLAEVCRGWEAATAPAREAGIRVVNLRTGPIQARSGASIRILLPLYRLGLAGPLGSGQQYVSWISIADVVGIILHCLDNDRLAGPVNATAPEPVPQIEYARTFARVLRRPAVIPVPRFGPKLVFGDMIDELVNYSQRAIPARLTASGYAFRHPSLEGALRAML